MKRETYQNKLADLLGLHQFKVEAPKSTKSKGKTESPYVGVTEDAIQQFRQVQGLVYFLQAPELFSHKVCPHCKESFLVSRQFVAFCSYTCIKKDLEAKGIGWSRDKDIEVLVKDVYEGNEPLWIREPLVSRLRAVLEQPQVNLLSSIGTSNVEQSTEPSMA